VPRVRPATRPLRTWKRKNGLSARPSLRLSQKERKAMKKPGAKEMYREQREPQYESFNGL